MLLQGQCCNSLLHGLALKLFNQFKTEELKLVGGSNNKTKYAFVCCFCFVEV